MKKQLLFMDAQHGLLVKLDEPYNDLWFYFAFAQRCHANLFRLVLLRWRMWRLRVRICVAQVFPGGCCHNWQKKALITVYYDTYLDYPHRIAYLVLRKHRFSVTEQKRSLPPPKQMAISLAIRSQALEARTHSSACVHFIYPEQLSCARTAATSHPKNHHIQYEIEMEDVVKNGMGSIGLLRLVLVKRRYCCSRPLLSTSVGSGQELAEEGKDPNAVVLLCSITPNISLFIENTFHMPGITYTLRYSHREAAHFDLPSPDR
ncbi:hypothetical protein K458DRAFT_394513 [Lentithecium fluviatile CBS 122367]|uniref:Uncharacterized protein n=1 Tax=Lentithecium fluviatile CBS 122367 TaxID=1168545 RepID=A0A6G1IL41_9PLEO|nr:hypothetical protein K458DRAFT_394513 [Lentithecium fluviatile CBS 122367]